MKVLVVDDDPSGRYLLESIVRSGGHDVVSASDGLEAIEVARAEVPDVAISDILMPRMDGYQLCRRWKSDVHLRSRPFVFYTASYTDPADEQFALDLGADAFWRKPVDPLTLLDRLEEVARLVRTPEEVRVPGIEDEREVLVEYNARLVHKVEQKAAELQRANDELKRAMEMLAEEISVKANLIAELNADIVRRKRLEADLRTERDFTKRVIDVPDIAVIVVDPEKRVRLFSRGAELVTGCPADDAVGRPLTEVLCLTDGDSGLAAAVAAGANVRLKEQLVTSSGDGMTIAWTVSCGDDGSVYLFGQDVTELERMQDSERVVSLLNEEVAHGASPESVLKLVCDAIAERFSRCAVAGALVDRAGAVVARAAACPERIDRVAARVVAPWEVVPGGDRALSGRPVVVGPEEPGLEVGNALWEAGVRGVAVLPLTMGGSVLGALVLFTCRPLGFSAEMVALHERVAGAAAAAIELARSREEQMLQSAALASAADAIAIVDERGRLVSWNRALELLTGYSADELHEIGLDALQSPTEGEGWLFVLGGVAESWAGETIGLRKDGSRFYERMTIVPVRGLEKTRFVVTKRDVTEERLLEQLRSGFVANVSHELRTPLTAIIGYAQLLAGTESAMLADKAGEIARKIEQSAERMRALVEELLEATTIQAEGGLKLVRRPIDLEQVVRMRAEQVPRTRDHRLIVDAEPEMPLVVCDPERIGRVVENLVSNAVKFSPNGGAVTVRLGTEEGEALIAVTDSGIGIRSEDMPKLFDRFTQADMSSTRAFGGMGMGLFVAEEIVRAHGGRIDVESVPGKGSTFTVRIPISG